MDDRAPHLATAGTLADLIGQQTHRERHRPLLTMYDDRTGGRTELSYATAANWASKTANLLVEEFDVGPGATVTLDVDGHWTAAILALACWKVGAAVRSPGGVHASGVVCRHESLMTGQIGGPTLVVGDGLRAEPVVPVPAAADVVLLGEDVHAFADDYDDPAVDAATGALVVSSVTLDHAALVADALRWRALLGDGARVGLAARLDEPASIALLAGVVASSGSIVAHRPPPPAPPVARWRSERVTVVVGEAGTLAGSDSAGISDIPFVPLGSPQDDQTATSD